MPEPSVGSRLSHLTKRALQSAEIQWPDYARVPFDPSGIGGAICQRLRDATRFVQNQDIATLEIEYGPLSVL